MIATKAKQALSELEDYLAVLSDLNQAQSLLGWDQNTYMPDGAAAGRAQQLGTLSKVIHERFTDTRVGSWLEDLEADTFPEDSDEAALLRLSRRDYDRAVKIPGDFLEDYEQARALGQQAWVKARADSDFGQFAPHLEKLVELNRRYADYLGYDDHPYNALHDLYEPGSKVEEVKKVFAELRDATVPLVKAIVSEGTSVEDAAVRQAFEEDRQEQFGVEVIKDFGYDFQRGRLDRAVHPFAQSIGKNDVRVTTRFDPNWLNPALFGMMHEAGHGMYEQGIADAYMRSPLGRADSLGIHESQSRLWENLVGRSRIFWQHAYPRLRELFPKPLGGISLDDFYAAINKVEPSLIRVEADEITYNLHIMVRFELELALLEGSLKVADVPEAWNAKYQEYLGLRPQNDAEGCLQDIHWSMGAIGYFPTYTLGNIMSVQLFEAAQAAHPELNDEIAGGKFATLLDWLRHNIHRHGAKFSPGELLKNATGSALDAKPYIGYLNRKFRSLYGLADA